MSTLRILFHLARADFLERMRRNSFLVTLLVIVAVTYFYIPAMDAPVYAYVNMGGYRPIYNSAWIGLMVSLLMAEFFPLFGFYLVKNTIERDRHTGVGEIIATTPISKTTYTLGKWLSNMAVFIAIVAVTILTSLILQFVRAEEFRVDLWALVAPFLFIILPEMAFIAALAVLFESISWLRGGFGSLVYYGVYAIGAIVGDLQGISGVWPSVYRACAAQFPLCNSQRQIDLEGGDVLRSLATFRFEGVAWTADIILPRLGWIGLAVLIAFLAALFFHRFDPAKVGTDFFSAVFGRLKQAASGFVMVPVTPSEAEEMVLIKPVKEQKILRLTPLPTTTLNPWKHWRQVLAAELRLTFKGTHWIWYVGALGIIVASLAAPLEIGQLVFLPLAWVWPVLIWSGLGVREMHHRTDAMVFSAPYPLRRHLPIVWLVGLIVSLGMGSGVLLRLILAGDLGGALAMSIGALFIPSLALALGCWSNTGKLFQAVYLFIWYLAAVPGVFPLDFMGHFPGIFATGLPWVYVALTALLLAAAVAGRQRQIIR